MFSNRFRFCNGSLCKLSVDGTDFRAYNIGGKEYYSHKFNGPALRYEVAVAIQSGDICHIAGPFRAGEMPDIKIFRRCLKAKLDRANRFCKEKVEADDGYRGEPYYISLPNELGGGGERQRKAKTVARQRQETINRKFKEWKILQSRYRHDVKFHKTVFRAIATITQIDLRSAQFSFQVEYKTMETRGELKSRKEMLKFINKQRTNRK